MGGFVLDISPLHDFHEVMTVTHHAVLALAKEGLLLPMSDDSIRDKSKAYYLAKIQVFCQVSFLVLQVIVRKTQHLPLTLLEIHTLVHVVCAASIYVAWFGKPLDIKDPTDISSTVWNSPVKETKSQWQMIITRLLVQGTRLRSWARNGSSHSTLEMDLVMFHLKPIPRKTESISTASPRRPEARITQPLMDYRSSPSKKNSHLLLPRLDGRFRTNRNGTS